MIKAFNDIGYRKSHKWDRDEPITNYSVQVTNLKYDTSTKVLSMDIDSYLRIDGDTAQPFKEVCVVIKSESTKEVISRLSGERYVSKSISVTEPKVIIEVLFYSSVYGSQTLDLTEPNTPPSVSDTDRNLGDKNTGFSISYQVSDKENDPIAVTEKLNGAVLRTLNNAPKNQDIVINIPNEQLYVLPLNQTNTISIEANDGKGGINYRNYTFRRTNTPPSISNEDKDLGVVTTLQEKYMVTDLEGNVITIVEKLDDTVLITFTAEANREYVTTIDKDTWLKLRNGKHSYTIEATDSNNSKSTRVFSFTKKETKIDFTLSKPFQTDIKASKILVTPSWELNGATAKIEACNNAFDANPCWEDITKQVLINRHYNFTNTAKTVDKWGINIRIYIEKDPSSVAEVSIKGFGGAFE